MIRNKHRKNKFFKTYVSISAKPKVSFWFSEMLNRAIYEVITVIEEKERFFLHLSHFQLFLFVILFNVDKYSNNKDIDGYQPILI